MNLILLSYDTPILIWVMLVAGMVLTWGVTNFHMIQTQPVDSGEVITLNRICVVIIASVAIGPTYLMFLYINRRYGRTNFFKFRFNLKDPGIRYIDDNRHTYLNPYFVEDTINRLAAGYEFLSRAEAPEQFTDRVVIIYDNSLAKQHVCFDNSNVSSDIRDWIVSEDVEINKYTGCLVNDKDRLYYDMKWNL